MNLGGMLVFTHIDGIPDILSTTFNKPLSLAEITKHYSPIRSHVLANLQFLQPQLTQESEMVIFPTENLYLEARTDRQSRTYVRDYVTNTPFVDYYGTHIAGVLIGYYTSRLSNTVEKTKKVKQCKLPLTHERMSYRCYKLRGVEYYEHVMNFAYDDVRIQSRNETLTHQSKKIFAVIYASSNTAIIEPNSEAEINPFNNINNCRDNPPLKLTDLRAFGIPVDALNYYERSPEEIMAVFQRCFGLHNTHNSAHGVYLIRASTSLQNGHFVIETASYTNSKIDNSAVLVCCWRVGNHFFCENSWLQ
jgi:uncharacterized membrane-anchored protein YhcB (DUF1043 family)